MTPAVIFDIDGTLVDSVDLHACTWHRALARSGRRYPYDEVRAQIGKGGDQLLDTLAKDASDREREDIERFRSRLFRRWGLPRVTAFPRVRDLFLHARGRGQRIAVASSSKPEELDVYLRIAGVVDLVDIATSAGDVKRTKPAPDIFAVALGRLAVSAADAVVIGDSPYDAQAAGKLGLRAAGVLCGGFPEAVLRAAGFVALYRDPADLLDRYDTSPLAG